MKKLIFVIALTLSGCFLMAQKEPQPKQQWEYLIISPGKVYFSSISDSAYEVGPKLYRYLYSDPLMSFVNRPGVAGDRIP